MPRRAAFFCLLCLALGGVGCAGLRVERDVDRIFADYQGPHVPGAAVMVVKDGRVVLRKTYGMADLEAKERVRPNTNFRLASVSKQFTAMAILLLVEEGKLTLDTSLRAVFPDFPAYADGITFRHLLRHTSGLLAYESLLHDTVTVQVTDRDVLDMMRGADSTYFAPGTAYRYSNSGYAVLAMAVEKLGGRPYAAFLKERIFEPLGMESTVAYQRGISTVPHRAYGYRIEGNRVTRADQSRTSAVLGDGGIYSSLEDLYRWDQALYTEALVPRGVIEQAFTPGRETYGYGWRIDAVDGRRRVHHTGSTRGFRTVIQRFPDDRLTVVVLTNRDGPEVAPMAAQVVAFFR